MRKLTALCLAIALIPLSQSYADTRIGMIKLQSGTASISRDQETLAASPGTIVLAGDIITTGMDGAVGILFEDDTRAAIGPNSEWNLETYTYDRASKAGDAELQLATGSLGLIAGDLIQRDPSSLRVKTPTTVIAVRGTEFAVEVLAATQ